MYFRFEVTEHIDKLGLINNLLITGERKAGKDTCCCRLTVFVLTFKKISIIYPPTEGVLVLIHSHSLGNSSSATYFLFLLKLRICNKLSWGRNGYFLKLLFSVFPIPLYIAVFLAYN